MYKKLICLKLDRIEKIIHYSKLVLLAGYFKSG